jgi:RHS repeat-associated protein
VVTSFDWNAAGQVVSIATDGVVDALFSYDALGRRRSLQANGVTRRWRFGGAVEANAADVPVAIDLGEVRIALGGSHRFRHADARGNTQYATNTAGQIESVDVYSAYGERATIGAADADFGFARGTHVATAGGEFVWLGARLLDPRSARFLSPDPIWNPLNAFAYTLGNPVDFWDETGLHPGHAGGSSDHKAIELGRIAVAQATAIAATATTLASRLPNPATIAAAIAAAVNLAAEQAKLRTLEKFHEQDYPVSLAPELAGPPEGFGSFDLGGFIDVGCIGFGCHGTPVVDCDGDAC